ncbi:collagen alpha-1(I) chain-like [Pyrgilauda ruficollis]|uniref:collagen alpha-1(I) chain-like n=1 Tax=Pyrgilauda ruficollis TaxID=221976 RepID=UPI001B88336D|nr:collagen alpha-1(I) chain-like [Pyrgilauda ruficollis]
MAAAAAAARGRPGRHRTTAPDAPRAPPGGGKARCAAWPYGNCSPRRPPSAVVLGGGARSAPAPKGSRTPGPCPPLPAPGVPDTASPTQPQLSPFGSLGTHGGDTRRGHTASQRELELGSPREGPDTREGDEVPPGPQRPQGRCRRGGERDPCPGGSRSSGARRGPPGPSVSPPPPPPCGQPGDGAALGMTHERHPSRSGDTHATSGGAATCPPSLPGAPNAAPPELPRPGGLPRRRGWGCLWPPATAARCHPGSGAGISPPRPALATGTRHRLGGFRS